MVSKLIHYSKIKPTHPARMLRNVRKARFERSSTTKFNPFTFIRRQADESELPLPELEPEAEPISEPEPESESTSESESGSESSENEGEDDNEENSSNEGSTKTISIETQTIEIEAGGSLPTPSSIFTDPTNGQGQLKLAMMWETVTEYDTAVGKMTEKCLISAEDPSQKFCEQLLNGVLLGADGSSVPLDTVSAEVVTQSSEQVIPTTVALATATEAGVTSIPPENTSAPTEIPSSSSISDTPPTTLLVPSGLTTISEIVASPTITSSAESLESPINSFSSPESSISIDFTVQPQPVEGTAAAASETADTLVIPGQELKVLPIGLGLFGGLVGIALLVVLYVTYQRRKFKKQFRSRKLAEKASPMGKTGAYGSA